MPSLFITDSLAIITLSIPLQSRFTTAFLPLQNVRLRPIFPTFVLVRVFNVTSIDIPRIYIVYLTMTAQPSLSFSSYPQPPFFASHPPLTNPLEVEQFHQSSFWNSQFPDFVFEKEIAVTESSLVWLGNYRNSCERVALKITDRFQTESSEKQHQSKENQFVKDHQLNCMVRVKEVGYNEEYRIMVMHYYPWDLQQVFTTFTGNKARKYTQEHFLFIVHVFRSIIEAVSELHSAGFVHRDLKPDNILIDQDFKIVLSDFGLVTKELEVDTSSSGTLEYLAPERLSKKRRQSPIKRSADVWSLGIILYELFTGENPYNGDSEDEIFQEICQGYIRSKEIPTEAMSLINGILEANSEKRLCLEEIKQHPFLQKEVDQLVLKNAVHIYL